MIPRVEPNLELIKGPIVNTGFQAAWLKNPDGVTQGKRWNLATCGTDCHSGPGCDLCLARVKALKAQQEGKDIGRVEPIPDNLFQPLKWKNRKNAFAFPEGDPFHKGIPLSFLLTAFDIMELCPQHNFVLTTKRHKKLYKISKLKHTNVFIGVSIEGQKYLSRADALLELPNNFHKVLFLAPMLTHMVLPKKVLRGVDWVVCSPERGGQGRDPRPCPEEWLVDLIKQVKTFDSNLPFFLDMPYQEDRIHRMGGKFMEVPAALLR